MRVKNRLLTIPLDTTPTPGYDMFIYICLWQDAVAENFPLLYPRHNVVRPRSNHNSNRWGECLCNSTYISVIQDPESQIEKTQQLVEFFRLNDPCATNNFTNWNANKAFVRGVLIKLNYRLRRSRSAKITDLLTEIRTLESQIRSNSSSYLAAKLSSLRYNLRETLCTQNKYYMRKVKLNYYANNKKAGKFLANHLKVQRVKTKIPHIYHPTTSAKVKNPQAIADAFADYYSSLYNLKDDPATPQPVNEDIDNFLAKINLPSLSMSQLQ